MMAETGSDTPKERIAALIGELIRAIQSGSLSDAEEAQAFTDLADLVSQLKSIGDGSPTI